MATIESGSALAAHEADSANPHATDLGNLGTGTLADLNAAVTDATLDDASGARPPTAHASDHVGGADPIPNATAGAAGLMPAADKSKLDSVETAADVTDAANVAAAGALMTTGGTMTGALAMGANAITTSSTVDGRDVSADGATLDSLGGTVSTHVGAANPHSGSLSTAHEGVGGAVHAVATTLAAGFMSAADKVKVDGVEAGATADQNASEVAFTPVGSVGATDVQAAIAEVDGDVTAAAGAAAAAQADATTALADAATAQATADAKAAIAGQIGGTAASPDVRGLRETSGPTLLTLGAVADGEYLVRSGAAIVGGTPAGGGGGWTGPDLGQVRVAEDFITGNINTSPRHVMGTQWLWEGSGPGGISDLDSESGHPGIIGINPDTASSCIYLPGAPSFGTGFVVGDGAAYFEAIIDLQALAVATTADYVLTLGLMADPNDTAPDPGIHFAYNRSIGWTNWRAITRDGTDTITDTGVAAAAGWHKFRIEINAAGTSVAFLIDGATVATNTTTIPGGTRSLQIASNVVAGTAPVCKVDWVDWGKTLTTGR